MKVVCIAYRKWAKDIYTNISNKDLKSKFFKIYDKNEISFKFLKNIMPDLILWYGWSSKIEKEIISEFYNVMLHPSPLPKYRGGSPIQNQIINGEKKSAVTLFKMDEGIDTGDIIYQEKFSLEGDLKDVFDRITVIGTNLTLEMISNFGNLTLKKQNENNSTYFSRRSPSQSQIIIKDIKCHTAEELHNKIRSLQDPYPNAYIECKNGTKLYLIKSRI